MTKYDYILPLSDERRVIFDGNRARIENTKTGVVGPWFYFHSEMPEIAAVYYRGDLTPTMQSIIIHFTDGRFCLGGVSGGHIVWWHDIQDAPNKETYK